MQPLPPPSYKMEQKYPRSCPHSPSPIITFLLFLYRQFTNENSRRTRANTSQKLDKNLKIPQIQMPEESWSLVETKALSHNEIWWIWRPGRPLELWISSRVIEEGCCLEGGFYFAWINVPEHPHGCQDPRFPSRTSHCGGMSVVFTSRLVFLFPFIHFLLFLNLTISVFEGKVLDGSWLFPAFPVLMVNYDNWVPLVFNKTDTDHLIIIESIFSIFTMFNSSCKRLMFTPHYTPQLWGSFISPNKEIKDSKDN